jgi:hypothetical protein
VYSELLTFILLSPVNPTCPVCRVSSCPGSGLWLLGTRRTRSNSSATWGSVSAIRYSLRYMNVYICYSILPKDQWNWRITVKNKTALLTIQPVYWELSFYYQAGLHKYKFYYLLSCTYIPYSDPPPPPAQLCSLNSCSSLGFFSPVNFVPFNCASLSFVPHDLHIYVVYNSQNCTCMLFLRW